MKPARPATWVFAATTTALVSLAGGCQILAGIDPRSLGQAADSGGVEGSDGSDTDGGLEGGADSQVDARALDASMDAPDGQTTDAAQVDARFCGSQDAANVVFCDDFDQPGRSSMAQTGWRQVFNWVPLGTMVADASFSAPASVKFRYDLDAGPTRSAAQASASFSASKSQLVISAEILVASPTGTAILMIDDGTCSIEWSFPTATLSSRCPDYTEYVTGTLTYDTWVAVSLSITRQAGGLHLRTVVGAGAPYDSDLSSDAGTLLTAPLSLQIGNADLDTTGTISFDNVLVQAF